MQSVTILPGRDKTGNPEPFQGVTLERGELCTIVGNTGSVKSRLIKDVEQLARGDSVTRRRVLLDGAEVPAERRQSLSSQLVAHLGQNMRFVLDASVEELKKVKGVGDHTAVFLRMLPAVLGRYQGARTRLSAIINSPEEAYAWLEPYFFGARNEMVYVLCMDGKRQVIENGERVFSLPWQANRKFA